MPAAPPAPGETSRALALRELTHSYRRGLLRSPRTVLHDISLEVSMGERIGLIGPNGSGKSTLLRIAAGVQRPTTGEVSVFGHPVEESSPRGRIGYVSDDSPYPPELSARSVLELFHRLHRLPAEGRRARRALCDAQLERAGLLADAHRPLGTFSRGMLRRFALAQAFLHGPELILLDEPTAGLDAPGYDVLASFLDEAVSRRAALVLASHVASDLVAFTDRVVVLVDGRVLREGAPASLLDGAHADSRMGALFREDAPPEDRDS